MKMKKLTSVALAAALAIGTFGFSVPAKATEQTTTTTDYVLTIPADFDVTEKGWKYAGDIAVAQNASFDTGKKITVSAASAHDFKLTKDNAVTGYGENYVGYDIYNATGEENTKGDAATSWEFSAEDIKAEGGAKQGIGVEVEDYTIKDLQAGEYKDTVTFTASVEDAGPAWNTVNLSTLTGGYTAQNNDMLTGTLSGNYKISIADGATVMLDGVTINGGTSNEWAGLTCLGDATIILSGENTVKGFHNENYPGLQAGPSGTTLTIRGEGTLNATGVKWASAIGSGYTQKCGNIVIEGGTITADATSSGGESAGIGAAGGVSSCGDITITGGTVTAKGGAEDGAGIGSGCSGSKCGNITITDGVTKVTAIRGTYGASIGAGWSGQCGTITIAPGANVEQK